MMISKFTVVFLVCYYFKIGFTIICDHRPKGATGSPSPAGTKFRILIATNPESYIPGQVYRVILEGKSSVVEEANQFNGFTLTAEPSRKLDDSYTYAEPLSAGTFQVMPDDLNTKIDENCRDMVVHTSHAYVSSVEVLWTAPDPGITCVLFRAAVMEQNLWYQDGDGLKLEICENDDADNGNAIESCCPCNEAKYEMKFEGMWTRQSHPLYFPANVWLTRFSDVIGASHSADYRFWKGNEMASRGLVEFSEKENSTILESEIKSNKTRTVIKAKGLTYPNITGKTFSMFRVDKEHHLLSIVSLIKPSPDWFVGISGLELCNKDCKWISQKVLDLYPYDLGLYADLKYMTKNESLSEPIPIQKIDHSNIYESPFHTNNTEKLKPLAKVHLTKSREYERNCSKNHENRPESKSSSIESFKYEEPSTTECTTSDCRNNNKPEPTYRDCENAKWGPFSPCSTPSCDVERVRVSFRQFDDHIKEYCLEHYSSVENIQHCKEECSGNHELPSIDSMEECTVTHWSAFSTCDSNKCVRIRSRNLIAKEKKTDIKCSRIIYHQRVTCPEGECARMG